MNGYIFAQYMIVMKELMRLQNQDFNIDQQALEKIDPRNNDEKARSRNWNLVCSELDKIGVCIDDEKIQKYI